MIFATCRRDVVAQFILAVQLKGYETLIITHLDNLHAQRVTLLCHKQVPHTSG